MKNLINKKTIGGVLLCVVLLLIFFSKTIYSYHQPEVTAVKPSKGKLSKVEMGYGTAQWAQTDSLYIAEAGVVDEIYVNEGTYVEAGQELFSMKYDREENDWKLEELQNTKKRLEAELLELDSKIESERHPDEEILNTRQQLAQAEKHASAAASLYEIGGVSAKELSEARDQVNYLRLKQDNLTRKKSETMQSLELQRKAKKLELDNQTILEEPYKKTQEIHNSGVVITAPSKGMVVSSYISKGEKVPMDSLAMTVGTGNEYYLECQVSLENNFIIAGDSCNLSNPSHQVKGVVSSVLPTAQQKTVRIRFTAENVTAGETFEVLFQKDSETSYILVPNAAVCQDHNGYYLKQIRRRDGIMGKEYYLDRIDIYIGDSDTKNTAVIQGVTFFEPVMLSSNKTAVIGDVISLKNAGDFFEE